MYKKYLINLLYYILGIILLGVIYEIIVLIKNDINFTPQFDDIFKSFFSLLGDINTYKGVINTIKNVLISVFISFSIALIFAVISYRFNIIHKILHPMMMILRFIPIIILINIIWFILAMKHKDYVLYLSVFSMLFPMIYETIYQGLKSIDKIYIDAYKIYSNTTPFIVYKVYMPLVFNSIKGSLLNALGLGIKIALSCEFILGMRETLGYLIQGEVRNGYGFEVLYAYILILIIVSVILELIPLVLALIYGKISKERAKKRFFDYGCKTKD